MSNYDPSRSRASRAAAEPEYLVVFDAPSEDNARTLAEALDIEPQDGPLASMGIRSMSLGVTQWAQNAVTSAG